MSNNSKLIKIASGAYQHWCPGCGVKHMFFTKECALVRTHWLWNESYEKPTIIPSIRHRLYQSDRVIVCHYRIIDGNIIYEADTTHEYRGKMIELLDISMFK